jgi:Mg-chelatase subunit ChlI
MSDKGQKRRSSFDLESAESSQAPQAPPRSLVFGFSDPQKTAAAAFLDKRDKAERVVSLARAIEEWKLSISLAEKELSRLELHSPELKALVSSARRTFKREVPKASSQGGEKKARTGSGPGSPSQSAAASSSSSSSSSSEKKEEKRGDSASAKRRKKKKAKVQVVVPDSGAGASATSAGTAASTATAVAGPAPAKSPILFPP